LKEAKCKQDGGAVDCNGHGTCFYEQGTAKCECEQGFADDGEEMCARC